MMNDGPYSLSPFCLLSLTSYASPLPRPTLFARPTGI